MDQLELLGPLAALVGSWEGEGGLDVSFHHAEGVVGDIVYREKCSFNAFGPVDNGTQSLYGLDYRSAMWRDDMENPFHTEIGYLLWDADAGQVLRCFSVPRGVTVLAAGFAKPDATTFTVKAEAGAPDHGVLQNAYLLAAARTVSFEMTITVNSDGSITYTSDTVLAMAGRDELLHHTDLNTLHRVG